MNRLNKNIDELERFIILLRIQNHEKTFYACFS